MKYFLCVIGMVFVLEGIPYFAFPEKVKELLVKMSDMPARSLRLMGFISMLLGLILVYLGRTG
ncbi:MAG TPA: DUF2065 domain-containing protein [Syntrophales bacterium]|nr:DUF2065 domain-containing protein [Syntrophales bacterium]HOL59949.1 DUF2065 domain-containing protein [Syntrophales bacterium]HPO36236.1 DUF2065 domain-containing protein [Syntrophales bacterium]